MELHPLGLLIFSIGAFSVNKPFLILNSDVLSFDLSKHQTHELGFSSTSVSQCDFCLQPCPRPVTDITSVTPSPSYSKCHSSPARGISPRFIHTLRPIVRTSIKELLLEADVPASGSGSRPAVASQASSPGYADLELLSPLTPEACMFLDYG